MNLKLKNGAQDLLQQDIEIYETFYALKQSSNKNKESQNCLIFPLH